MEASTIRKVMPSCCKGSPSQLPPCPDRARRVLGVGAWRAVEYEWQTLRRIGFLLVLLSLLSLPFYSQKFGKCKIQNQDAARLKYFVGHMESVEARGDDRSGVLVNIAIKSDQFERDYLIRLSTNLKNRARGGTP
jgi:hypothetical protein